MTWKLRTLGSRLLIYMKENLASKRLIQIFEKSGFDLDIIGKKITNKDLKG